MKLFEDAFVVAMVRVFNTLTFGFASPDAGARTFWIACPLTQPRVGNAETTGRAFPTRASEIIVVLP